jgi:hypothetical protein
MPYDSTLHKTPRQKPSRLPAQVVEPRNYLAGDTQHNESLALAVRCIGLVVNMTSGRTIRAEPGDGYPNLNRDGVGMPAGREASGPLEAAYGMALAKPVLLFKRPTRIHSHEKTATVAVQLVSVC